MNKTITRADSGSVRQTGLIQHASRFLFLCVLCPSLVWGTPATAQPMDMARAFEEQVHPRLILPVEESDQYGLLALKTLSDGDMPVTSAQYIVVVDRNPNVQAVFLYWIAPGAQPILIGAAPTSTGSVGGFDHFETPLGVFAHSMENPDFRAEGTKNSLGFRGYGVKGMRVYDLGWQQAKRGWGRGGESQIRLQMHSTDPDLAESKLGTAQSKGCIRIPASLNILLDHFGVLDADYNEMLASGSSMWVLKKDRTAISNPGRYIVVVDSARTSRPEWSPGPASGTGTVAGPRAGDAKQID